MNRLALLIFIPLLIPSYLDAQIVAPGRSSAFITQYPGGHSPNDSVFVFCDADIPFLRLEADAPGGVPPYNFEWHRWSSADGDFTEAVHSETDVGRSVFAGVEEGGYRVTISGSGYDTTLIAWVHIAETEVSASLSGPPLCYEVRLAGQFDPGGFSYYDPGNGQEAALTTSLKEYSWYIDDNRITTGTTDFLNYTYYILPYEDVYFTLRVTDRRGCVSESSFLYEPLHVKADFTVEPASGEAPLEVVITDNSIRAVNYTWDFGNDTTSATAGSLTHTYYRPGTYTLTLTVESENLCVATMVETITVDDSGLDVPNVFTPNGDGVNDYFRPETSSLRMIDMQIFSRTGAPVYSFRSDGERLDDWKGWDGTINNSSREASPGVYFYIIRALGWDDIFYEPKEYRGFLYLFR